MVYKYLLVSVLFFTQFYPVFPTISGAREAYKNGNYDKSIQLYSEYLEKNKPVENLYDILTEISGQRGNIEDISSLVLKNSEFLTDRTEKHKIFLKLAEMYELRGNLNEAQKLYMDAALSNFNDIDYSSLLKSAILLIFEGDYITAESQIKEVILNSDNQTVKTNGVIFYNILLFLTSRDETNKEPLYVNTPEFSYLLYILSQAKNDTDAMDKLKTFIENSYNLSPEFKLLTEQISLVPNVMSSLGLLHNYTIPSNKEITVSQPEKTILPFLIQTGSFRDKENARYLAEDLKSSGFTPIVDEQEIDNTIYYKVLLYYKSMEEAQTALDKLSAAGFAGFPIY